MDWYDPTCYDIKSLDAKYEKVSTDEVVDQLEHLSPHQKKDLREVKKSFEKLLMEHWGCIPIGNSTLN